MTVYVDDMRAPYGRLIMCHMIADTDAELHAMADRIGVKRKWHQGDHYDIALAKRALAVAAGAREITQRQLGIMAVTRRRHPDLPLITPEEADARIQSRRLDIQQTMRCKSGMVHPENGDCIACHAANGEVCRFGHQNQEVEANGPKPS
jgi:hypothetical protein